MTDALTTPRPQHNKEALETLLSKVEDTKLRDAINTVYTDYVRRNKPNPKDIGKEHREIHVPINRLFQFLNKLIENKQEAVS